MGSVVHPKAAQTLSEYYIKKGRAVSPGRTDWCNNEVTVVFQDGFQLKNVEELEAEKERATAGSESGGGATAG